MIFLPALCKGETPLAGGRTGRGKAILTTSQVHKSLKFPYITLFQTEYSNEKKI